MKVEWVAPPLAWALKLSDWTWTKRSSFCRHRPRPRILKSPTFPGVSTVAGQVAERDYHQKWQPCSWIVRCLIPEIIFVLLFPILDLEYSFEQHFRRLRGQEIWLKLLGLRESIRAAVFERTDLSW